MRRPLCALPLLFALPLACASPGPAPAPPSTPSAVAAAPEEYAVRCAQFRQARVESRDLTASCDDACLARLRQLEQLHVAADRAGGWRCPDALVPNARVRALLAGAAVKSADPSTPFDAAAAQAAVDQVDLAGCPQDPVHVRVTNATVYFDESGFAGSAYLDDDDAAMTDLGACVVRRLATARVAPFTYARAKAGSYRATRSLSFPWATPRQPLPQAVLPADTDCAKACEAHKHYARGALMVCDGCGGSHYGGVECVTALETAEDMRAATADRCAATCPSSVIGDPFLRQMATDIAAKKEGKPTTYEALGKKRPLDRVAAQRALDAVDLTPCGFTRPTTSGAGEPVMVQIHNSGYVARVTTADPALAATDAGVCLVKRLGAVRVTPFGGGAWTEGIVTRVQRK